MKTIDDYIYEVLHLNSGNKDLVNMNDPSDFIESFEDKDEQIHIIQLLNFAVTRQESNVEEGITDRLCYVVKTTRVERNGTPVYKWDSNKYDDIHNVGDKTRHGSTVIYVVTSDTILPEKYKKMLR